MHSNIYYRLNRMYLGQLFTLVTWRLMLTLVSFYDNLSPLLACSYSHFISWVLSQLQIINHPYFSDADGIEGGLCVRYHSHLCLHVDMNGYYVSTDHHGAPFTTELNIQLYKVEIKFEDFFLV